MIEEDRREFVKKNICFHNMAAPLQVDIQTELAQLRQELNHYHQADTAAAANRQALTAQNVAVRAHDDHERTVLKQLISQTANIDGSSPPAIRNWFRELEVTIPLTGGGAATIEIATRTVSGSLRLEAERWIAAQAQAQPPIPRNQIAWNDLRTHIANAFLTTNEDEFMRTEVEATRQTAFETEACYTRRFRDVAAVAYPAGGRNVDQDRILLSAYIKGLKNKEIARELILRGDPADMEAAMTLVSQYSGAEERLKRLGVRNEEPMEVNAIVMKTDSTDAVSKSLEKIMSKLAVLECRLQETETLAISGPASQGQSRKPGPTQKKCAYCHRTGHIVAECRTKRRNNVQRRPTNDACYNCGRKGHFARDCRSATRDHSYGPSQRQYPQRPAGSADFKSQRQGNGSWDRLSFQ